MVKKQYLKSTRRLFTKHIIRLLSIAAIFVVSIGLMSGLGVVKYNVKQYVNDVYSACNVYDLKVVSSPDKISELKGDLQKVKEEYDLDCLETAFTFDFYLDGEENKKFAKRIQFEDFSDYESQNRINKLTLLDDKVSRFPNSPLEAVAVESTNDIKKHNVGDTFEFEFLTETYTIKIVGIVKNPNILAKSKEPSSYYDEDKTKKGEEQVHGYLDDYIIVNSKELLEYYPDTLLLTFKEDYRNKFNNMSGEYLNIVNTYKNKISKAYEIDVNQILTLEQNFSFKSLISYADKVGIIAAIFIGFFSLITLLVVFSTMSRLFDEDRGSMAVLKTLGYSNFAIAMRYVAFVAIAGIVGGALALLPSIIVNNMIIGGFMMQYNLWQISIPTINGVFFFCTGLILLLSIIITVITALKAADKKPVELLTPKAPKVGKKILLERIKPVWNKLSFKYKSTCRNVFLFKGRFFMTFFSIIASTAIVFASLALFDNSINNLTTGMDTTAIKIISLVLLVFSAILCALVVYNITNINISERKREIATLMVLGYRSKEVKGYVYREIYIMAIISSLVGLPTGIGFVYWVFNLMNFGELRFVNWWTYILTPILTFLFALLATLFLNKKITKTDMNESLKVLE